MPAVVIPRLLRDTFGDEVAETLVGFINQLLEDSRLQTLAFSEDWSGQIGAILDIVLVFLK